MALSKRIGLGVTLGVDTAGGTSYTTLAAVVDGLNEGESKATMVDTTVLSDTFMTKSKSQIDPGEVTLTIAYDPDEATSVTLKTLHASTSATPPTWLITLPSGTLGAGTITTKSFAAHLSGMGREIKRDGMIVCSITLTKTGNPGF